VRWGHDLRGVGTMAINTIWLDVRFLYLTKSTGNRLCCSCESTDVSKPEQQWTMISRHCNSLMSSKSTEVLAMVCSGTQRR
jgi:hypothetical protein